MNSFEIKFFEKHFKTINRLEKFKKAVKYHKNGINRKRFGSWRTYDTNNEFDFRTNFDNVSDITIWIDEYVIQNEIDRRKILGLK